MCRRIAFLLAAAVLVCDVISKALAVHFLEGQAPIALVGNFLKLSFARNPGAAFSFGTSSTLLFTVLAIGMSLALGIAIGRVHNKYWALALGGVLGGALGNVVDRFFRSPSFLRGHVVDFIEFPHYPLFNLADSAIVISGVVIALLTFRGVPFGADQATEHPRVESS
jgi:signal peptidase II